MLCRRRSAAPRVQGFQVECEADVHCAAFNSDCVFHKHVLIRWWLQARLKQLHLQHAAASDVACQHAQSSH